MTRRLLGAVSGLVVWAVHFVAVYALVGVGCERAWDVRPLAGSNALSVLLVAVTVPALALIAWIGWRGWQAMRRSVVREAPDAVRRAAAGAAAAGRIETHGSSTGAAAARGTPAAARQRFLGALTLTLAVIAFIATLMTALPIVMLSPCA